MTELTLVGRSSSHFTRVARMFALELGVAHAFRPVFDLTTLDPEAYAGNPALKIPILVDEEGALFGAENICRALTRRSGKSNVVLRGDVGARAVANAEELTLNVMSTEVLVITAKFANQAPPPKALPSIEQSLDHLEENLGRALALLPADRQVSFLEVALFSVLTHLPFREVFDVSRWERLAAFARDYGQRASAKSTEYRFDQR